MTFCFQGDGKDGGDEGGGERSGWGASQVKILLTFLLPSSSSWDSIIVKVTSIPELLQKYNLYFQHLQRVDGVHHLLVDLRHHRSEHLHGKVPGQQNFSSDSHNFEKDDDTVIDGFFLHRSVWTRRTVAGSTTRSSRTRRCAWTRRGRCGSTPGSPLTMCLSPT